MFTGIIEAVGTVRTVSAHGDGLVISIEAGKIADDARTGDSLSVNGICLTITNINSTLIFADISHETIQKTALTGVKNGSRVNLERALRLGDRLGGHIVTGHVDGTGIITKADKSRGLTLAVSVVPSIRKYIIYKGSVTLNGMSLTVSDIIPDGFRVSLIPHTVKHTTIGERKKGDRVNIECDIIGKYIENFTHHFQETPGGGKKVTRNLLAEHGFL